MSVLGYVLKIDIRLCDGSSLLFEASGAQENGRINYMSGWPKVSISPKQLATAKSVDELVKLLASGVQDVCDFFEVDEEGDEEAYFWDGYIFSASRPVVSDVDGNEYDAYDYVELIRNNISDMDTVESVTIEMKHFDEWSFFRSYTYERHTKKYYGTVLGATSAMGDEYDDEIDDFGPNDFQFVLKREKCKILNKTRFYTDANSDDIYSAGICAVIKQL